MTTPKRPRTHADPPETHPDQDVSHEQPSHSCHSGESELTPSRASCLVGTQRAGNEHKHAYRRDAYEFRANLDGCTVFPYQLLPGPRVLIYQRRQNKANVSLSKVYRLYGCRTRSVQASLRRQNKANVNLGKMYNLTTFMISADLGRTNPFFTRSSQSPQRLTDPAIRLGRNRENEPIAVTAIIPTEHSSILAAMRNQRNKAIAVIAIGRDADPCFPGMPADRRDEANLILDRICRLERRTVAWHMVDS